MGLLSQADDGNNNPGQVSPSQGASATLPNGLVGTWAWDFNNNTWSIVDGSGQAIGHLSGPNIVNGPPVPTGNSQQQTTTPAPVGKTMTDWHLPFFPATYAGLQGLGGYESLQQQMQFDLARQMQHDPQTAHFARWNFGGQDGASNPGNGPPPPTGGGGAPPPSGGGGGIGGVPGLGGPPRTPGAPPGTTTGNPLERQLGQIPNPTSGTGAYYNLTPEQIAQITSEIGGAFGGLMAPLNGPYGSSSSAPTTPTQPGSPPPRGGGSGGTVRPIIQGASQQVDPRGLLDTPTTAPSALLSPTNQSASLTGFRFQNPANAQETNYNALAGQSPQAAGAYLNANRNLLGGAMGAQGGPSQQAINTFGGGTNYGGPGLGYSGGGMDVYGNFSTGLSAADAARMGLTKNPLSGMYQLPLAQSTPDPYNLAGTPIGGLLSRYAPQIQAAMSGQYAPQMIAALAAQAKGG